jgi:hypothetical protein
MVKATPHWLDKIKLLVSEPSKVNYQHRQQLERVFLFPQKSVEPANQRFRAYVVGQMAFIITFLFGFLLLEHYFSPIYQLLASLLILVTLINCGAILEQRRWVFHLEYIRIFIGLAALHFYFYGPWFWLSYILFATWLIHCFVHIERYYLRLVYGKMLRRT